MDEVAGWAPQAPCPILDTHTQECAHLKGTLWKLVTGRQSRKIFSRVMMGLNLPGRYYFLTLTTTPDDPLKKSHFNALRMYLKRQRPGVCWIYCMTMEGNGVIHMVLRLPMKSKNYDVKELRRYWHNLTGATQIRIERVGGKRKNLANYLSDQRKKRKMGSEMSWQDMIVSWGWSKGWIPKGFTKIFGRMYIDWIDAPEEVKQKVIRDAVNIAHKEVLKNGRV